MARSGTRQITQITAKAFSGPLPAPEILEQYNRIHPDFAERIVVMTEQQSAHRRSLESQVVQGNLRAQTRGQWLGFVIYMTGVIGGFWLIASGQSGFGIAAVIGSLATMTSVFMWGRKRQEKERGTQLQGLDEAARRGTSEQRSE